MTSISLSLSQNLSFSLRFEIMSGKFTQSAGEIFAIGGSGLGRTLLLLQLIPELSFFTFLLTVFNCFYFDPQLADFEVEG